MAINKHVMVLTQQARLNDQIMGVMRDQIKTLTAEKAALHPDVVDKNIKDAEAQIITKDNQIADIKDKMQQSLLRAQ